MFSLSIFWWVVWGFLLGCALVICYIASRPGNRRKKSDPSFNGEERRSNDTTVDFVNQPVITRRKYERSDCRVCNKRH